MIQSLYIYIYIPTDRYSRHQKNPVSYFFYQKYRKMFNLWPLSHGKQKTALEKGQEFFEFPWNVPSLRAWCRTGLRHLVTLDCGQVVECHAHIEHTMQTDYTYYTSISLNQHSSKKKDEFKFGNNPSYCKNTSKNFTVFTRKTRFPDCVRAATLSFGLSSSVPGGGPTFRTSSVPRKFIFYFKKAWGSYSGESSFTLNNLSLY